MSDKQSYTPQSQPDSTPSPSSLENTQMSLRGPHPHPMIYVNYHMFTFWMARLLPLIKVTKYIYPATFGTESHAKSKDFLVAIYLSKHSANSPDPANIDSRGISDILICFSFHLRKRLYKKLSYS